MLKGQEEYTYNWNSGSPERDEGSAKTRMHLSLSEKSLQKARTEASSLFSYSSSLVSLASSSSCSSILFPLCPPSFSLARRLPFSLCFFFLLQTPPLSFCLCLIPLWEKAPNELELHFSPLSALYFWLISSKTSSPCPRVLPFCNLLLALYLIPTLLRVC